MQIQQDQIGAVVSPSSSEEAKSLRAELYAMGKRRRRIEVGGRTYELRCRTYDSFGEDAFEVKFRPVGERPRRPREIGGWLAPLASSRRRLGRLEVRPANDS